MKHYFKSGMLIGRKWLQRFETLDNLFRCFMKGIFVERGSTFPDWFWVYWISLNSFWKHFWGVQFYIPHPSLYLTPIVRINQFLMRTKNRFISCFLVKVTNRKISRKCRVIRFSVTFFSNLKNHSLTFYKN